MFFDIVALHALWGTSIPMSKQLLSYVSPVFLTAARLLASGLLLFAINFMRNAARVPSGKLIWLYNGQIIVAIYAKYMLRNWGLAHMPATKMSFLTNMTPFVAALFSYFAFKEKLTSKQWLGLTIGFIGLMPMVFSSSASEAALGEFFYISWAELAIFIAVVAEVYAMIISRILIREHGQSVVLSNGIRMLGGGVLAALSLIAVPDQIYISDFAGFAFWFTGVIVVSNIICQNFRLHLYKYYTITFLSFTDYLSPLFTALYSWMFLNESIGWQYIFSAAILFFGLYLFYQDELKVTGVRKAVGESS